MREAPLQLDLQYIALLLTALGESRKVFEREHMLVLNEHRSSCGWHCISSQTCEPGLTVWCHTASEPNDSSLLVTVEGKLDHRIVR